MIFLCTGHEVVIFFCSPWSFDCLYVCSVIVTFICIEKKVFANKDKNTLLSIIMVGVEDS